MFTVLITAVTSVILSVLFYVFIGSIIQYCGEAIVDRLDDKLLK